MFMEMIIKKDKVSPRKYIICLLLVLQVLCGGCRLGFVRAPFNLFHVPSTFWLVLLLAGQPLCGLWLRVDREVECTVLRV